MSTQKFSPNASKFAQKYARLSGTGISQQQITFGYVDGISKDKQDKKTLEWSVEYSARKATKEEKDKGGLPIRSLSINWQQTEKGQELLLIKNGETVATFATLVTGEIAFNPYPIWDIPAVYIAIPTHSAFKPIESISVNDFFTQWLTSEQFFSHIALLSERGTYTPQLVKMTLLFNAYLHARDLVIETDNSLDVYTREIMIDKDALVADYLDSISLLTDEEAPAKMKKLFRNANSVMTLAPASETPLQLKPAEDPDQQFEREFKELIESNEGIKPEPDQLPENNEEAPIEVTAQPVDNEEVETNK